MKKRLKVMGVYCGLVAFTSLAASRSVANVTAYGINHASEQAAHTTKGKQKEQEVRDVHNMMLHHGVVSLEHSGQSTLHEQHVKSLSTEQEHFARQAAKYRSLSAQSHDPETTKHLKTLGDHSEELAKVYQKKAECHKKLGELHKKMAQNNLEIAEQSSHLKKSTQRSGELHRRAAQTHKKLH
ncbi:MAG: hypothetical protein LBJ03_01145 [Holosporales bacterium]|jgi:hypothetical protein|nr:hypothetical protein [Holosporales bacterium]